MSYTLKNPIINGFYPDPSIIRVGDDFYIACSSFEMCPGVPIFHSKDLANWEQICYALTADNGFHVEKNGLAGGIMAPTIRYYNGTYYIINANFSDYGNYIITAKDPAGPWSAPHYLKEDCPGIDASIFFDDDGKCYLMGTGEVWDNGAGQKERGIWLVGFDIENYKVIGEPVCIFNSALRGGASPESPHLYHIGDYYYLIIAEGGTEHFHAVMVARSKDLFGFYENYPGNPVLTHRHLGWHAEFINIGHADLVQLQDGSWYAVMLGSRLIEGAGKNLGRETFICPVIWERDWPVFAPETGLVEKEYPAPACLTECPVEKEITRDDFDSEELALCWSFLGTPYEKFHEIRDSRLYLDCLPKTLYEDLRKVGWEPEFLKDTYVSALLRRQREIHQTASCAMNFLPEGQESAGITVLQSMNHLYLLERYQREGRQLLGIRLVTCDYEVPYYLPWFTSTTNVETIKEVEWEQADIVLSIEMDGEKFTVCYGADEQSLTELAVVDGLKINPEKVGCMVGTTVGMYATGNGERINNKAAFDWFELV